MRMTLNNNCRKFQANIFNKSRCQNCFKAKDEHSAEALECSRTARKVCLCGHLFVAPDVFDFSNPIDRTKRWQRRFFVIYDSGELTYSVDENVGTVPQAEINLNLCSEVFDAQQVTTHQFSVGIAAQGSVTYIKGTSKDEILRWQEMLLKFSQSRPAKSRTVSLPAGIALKDLPPMHADHIDDLKNKMPSLSVITCPNKTDTGAPNRVDPRSDSTTMTSDMEGLNGGRHRYYGAAHPKVADGDVAAQTYRGVRSLKHKNDRAYSDTLKKSSSLQNLAESAAAEEHRAAESRHRSQSGDRSRQRAPMAKTADKISNRNLDNSNYIKKGWLLKQAKDKSWPKFWCVLSHDALTCYPDTGAELTNDVAAVIPLNEATSIEDLYLNRNFAFKIVTGVHEFALAAMTLNIRASWTQCLACCVRAPQITAPNGATSPAPSDAILSRATLTRDATDGDSVTRRNSVPRPSCTWPFSVPPPPPPGFREGALSPSSVSQVSDLLSPVDASTRPRWPTSTCSSGTEDERHLRYPDTLARQYPPHPPHHYPSLPARLSPSSDAPTLRMTAPAESPGADLHRHDNRDDAPRSRRRREEQADDESAVSSLGQLAAVQPVQHRAPSTRVRERTRNKSPRRVRSPPPSVEDGEESDDLELCSESSREFEQIAMNNSLLQVLEAEVQGLKTKLKDALHVIGEKSAEVDSLRRQLSRLDQRCTPAELCDLKRDSEESRRRLDESELLRKQELQRFELQLARANCQMDSFASELEQAEARLRQKEDANIALKLSLGDKNLVGSEMESLRRQLRENDVRVESLQRTCLERVRDADNKRDEAESRAQQLRLKLDEASAELGELAVSVAMVDMLREKDAMIACLEERLKETDNKMLATSKALEAELETTGELRIVVANQKNEIMELSRDVELERTHVGGLEAERTEAIRLRAESDAINASLRRSLEQAEARVVSVDAQNRELQESSRRLDRDVAVLKDTVMQKNVDIECLMLKLDAASSKTPDSCFTCAASAADLRSAQERIVDLEQEHLELTSIFEDHAHVVSQLELSRKRLDGLTEELKCSRRDADEDLREKDKMAADLRSRQEEVIQELQKAKKELMENKRKNTEIAAELSSNVERHRMEIAAKCSELSSAVSLVEDLRCQLQHATDLHRQASASPLDAPKSPNPDGKFTLFDADLSQIGKDFGTESDLSEKYTFAVRQLKRVQAEGRQREARRVELEQSVAQLRLQLRQGEVAREEQLGALHARIKELTSKLEAAERRNLRLERCRSDDHNTPDTINNNNDSTAVTDCSAGDSSDDLASRFRLVEDRLLSVEQEKLELIARLQRYEGLSKSSDALGIALTSHAKPAMHEVEQSEANSMMRVVGSETQLSCNSAIEPQACDFAKSVDRDEEVFALQRTVEELGAELRRRDESCAAEVQDLRDGYDVRIRSLQRDLAAARAELVHAQAELARPQAELTCAHAERDDIKRRLIATEAELKQTKAADKELPESETILEREDDEGEGLRHAKGREGRGGGEEGKQWMGDLGELGNEGSEITVLRQRVEELTRQLEQDRSSNVLRRDVSLEPDGGATGQMDAHSRIQLLEEQLHSMQVDYEQALAVQKTAHRRELVHSREDVMQQLAAAEANSIPIDEESVRRKYLKEVERVKDMHDRGFSAMEKSHQRTMMDMRRNHKLELDRLRAEKDQLLVEETQATQAAMDAMRKAHEAELEKERNKFLDLLTKTYSHADMDSLQRQHEDDIRLVQYELRQLSEQFSLKCIESAALSERLDAQTRALHQSRTRVQDLLVRNEELNTRLKFDIEKLNRLAVRSSSYSEYTHPSQDMGPLRLALQVKQTEVAQLEEELLTLRCNLSLKTEELQESTERYQELYAELQARRPSLDYLHPSDSFPPSRRSFDSSRVSLSGDAETGGSQDDLGASNSSSELSLNRMDATLPPLPLIPPPLTPRERSSLESDQLPTEALQTVLPRRSLWRLRNPQRAHSSPAGAESVDLSVLKSSMSMDAGRDPGVEGRDPGDEAIQSRRSRSGAPISADADESPIEEKLETKAKKLETKAEKLEAKSAE